MLFFPFNISSNSASANCQIYYDLRVAVLHTTKLLDDLESNSLGPRQL